MILFIKRLLALAASVKGQTVKCVPFYIGDYLTPIGLAHVIMQDGSYQKDQGINIATNCFTFDECNFLSTILTQKYKIKTSVIKTGSPDQWLRKRFPFGKNLCHYYVKSLIHILYQK